MTSTTPKAPKEKPLAAGPRLAPRPTAASAARAARNATNRNLLPASRPKQPPTRSSSSPSSVKGKAPAVRNLPRTDSKSDLKTSRNSDIEGVAVNNISVPTKQDNESYIVENISVVIIEETPGNKVQCGSVADTEELNEIDHFDDKHCEDVHSESFDQVSVHLPRSRPHTPSMSSRPQTPKNLQCSRPQTPKIPSRPTTPVHPRHTTPVSRPNTPLKPATPNKTSSPLHEKITSPNLKIIPPPIKEDEDIKTVYTLKQQQFQSMKKELDLKQQAVLELFDCLRGLRERMSREGLGGGEGLQQQELVVFNVADWAADEVAQLCRDAAASAASDGAEEIINDVMPFDECALAEMDAKIVTFPSEFADLCLQAFSARQELCDWVKNLLERNPEDNSESLEKIARYNAQGFELCDTLRELKNCADTVVETVTQLSRRACRERSALVAVGESLVREIAHLRQELETRMAAMNDRQDQGDNETTRLLQETRRELEEERTARAATKDKLATAESQLRQTRIRVSKMDRQLREAEASIASLTGTVKSLEDQSRQREVQLEARARKLKESLKTGELNSVQLAQQRDALQAEVTSLKEQIETMTKQHKETVQDLTNQLKDVKTLLLEQKHLTQQEFESKQALQVSLNVSHDTIEELKAKITELENSRPNPELPTEREMDLWAELQSTKDTLRMTEEEVTACKREKVRFLETMTKITESDNKVGMQQKLAAELLSKEEIVGKMQMQIRELTKNIKLNEQKVIQYEQYVRDLQAHNRAVANGQEAPDGISYEDLQQEIMNLRMSLLEAVHRNEELTEILMQKEQQLEQQDKTSRAQARVIKVREELINMLKNKETEQSRELAALQQDIEHRMNTVGEVNKQIASKAEEIQELFATLENKQQQIHRLEKIVLALEEQQRRAQAQRTRHEEKIAALEHELAAGGNRRERKFLFF